MSDKGQTFAHNRGIRVIGWMLAAVTFGGLTMIDWREEPAAVVFLVFQGSWFALMTNEKSNQTTAKRWLVHLTLVVASVALFVAVRHHH